MVCFTMFCHTNDHGGASEIPSKSASLADGAHANGLFNIDPPQIWAEDSLNLMTLNQMNDVVDENPGTVCQDLGGGGRL